MLFSFMMFARVNFFLSSLPI